MTNLVALTVLSQAIMFSDMVHNMHYGEPTTNVVTKVVTTRMDKAVVLDDDGVTREFVIDNYKLDPPAGVRCTYVHPDKKCAYWDMYLKRYAIYMERDRLREKWMREEMERQQNPTGRSALLNRFRRRVLP